MDKRYQVFVSSTYTDLQDERRRVIQTLMEMDCIPSGMELFPAADEEQFEFIKRVIDDCDYYILILGGRYGSLDADGISFTEKEYRYAESLGIKVLGFVHKDPNAIALGKSDADPVLRERLRVFRDEVCKGRLVQFWSSADQLPGLVAVSLQKTIKLYPAIGWVRANQVSRVEELAEINDLRKYNEILQLEIQKIKQETQPSINDIAGLDENVTLTGYYTFYSNKSQQQRSCKVTLTWRDIFGKIAPVIMENPNDTTVELKLGGILFEEKGSHIIEADFHTIKIQFIALKLVLVQYLSTVQGGMAWFWSLTPLGNKLLMELRTVRTQPVSSAISPITGLFLPLPPPKR